MGRKTAVIAGAGPAGLTAAYELLEKTDIIPVVYEQSSDIGGISKTINYKGNRMDIGGHRFFSKSDRVMEWWQRILPLQGRPSRDDILLDRDIPLSKKPNGPDPEKTDRVMLVRSRLSRIFFMRKFFEYPISLSWNTFSNLGVVRIARIGLSYAKVRMFPLKKEKSLEDFLINRFGRELYLTFFKDYTEKVWGVPCSRIKPEWGAQRIKGLSVSKAIMDAAKSIFRKSGSIEQKDVETTLIKQFLYPKLGPGQMWEEVARIVKERGGEIYLNMKVCGVSTDGRKVKAVRVRNEKTGDVSEVKADYFFSSMPIKELVGFLDGKVPDDVRKKASGLLYRDFMTVGLLLKRMRIKNNSRIKSVNNIVPDNWIYIQEPDVKLARIQIFNNWSPYLVKDDKKVWAGLEYMCNEGDELWSMGDREFAEFAIGEIAKLGFVRREDVLDSIVVRMPKAYPAYFGTYDSFGIVREFLDRFENLFLIGRNGMHRYNNQDHSMLTAMVAVENIIKGIKSKDNIWSVNAEQEYHEERK